SRRGSNSIECRLDRGSGGEYSDPVREIRDRAPLEGGRPSVFHFDTLNLWNSLKSPHFFPLCPTPDLPRPGECSGPVLEAGPLYRDVRAGRGLRKTSWATRLVRTPNQKPLTSYTTSIPCDFSL